MTLPARDREGFLVALDDWNPGVAEALAHAHARRVVRAICVARRRHRALVFGRPDPPHAQVARPLLRTSVKLRWATPRRPRSVAARPRFAMPPAHMATRCWEPRRFG